METVNLKKNAVFKIPYMFSYIQPLRVLILFLIPIISAYGQKTGLELIDSLKSACAEAPGDTDRVKILGKISFNYYNFDTDSGIFYGRKALDLSEKSGWDKGIALSNNYIGINYGVKGDFPKSLDYFRKSLNSYIMVGDKQGEAYACNNIGNLYRIMKNYEKSIEYLDRAVDLNIELGNKLDQMKSYSNLGITYTLLQNNDKAVENLNKTMALAKELNLKEIIANTLLNLSDIKINNKDYCSGLKFAFQALEIAGKLDNIYLLSSLLADIGKIFLSASEDQFFEGNKCELYPSDKRTALLMAENYFLRSNEKLKPINDLPMISQNMLSLSRVYENLGDYKSAILYLKKYDEIQDSIISLDKALKISEVEKKLEVELRDKQIEIKNVQIREKQNQINLLIIIFILLIIVVVLGIYLVNKRKEIKLRIKTDHERQRMIEELTEAKEKAESASILKDSFINNISHEIRTPLNGILGYTNLIKETYFDRIDEEDRGMFSGIEESSERIVRTFDLILDYSRIRSGDFILEKENIDLENLCRECLSRFTMLAKLKKIGLSFRNDFGPVILSADNYLLRQTLIHLLDNAIKYTNKGKVELIMTEGENHSMQIKVVDSGVGIRADLLPHVFAPYNQEEMGYGRKYEGVGLGLSLAKEFSEMNDASLSVQSQKGLGTTFTIEFNLTKRSN